MKLVVDKKSHFVETIVKLSKTFVEMNFEVTKDGVRLCAPNMNNTMMMELFYNAPQDEGCSFAIQMSDLAEMFGSFDKGDIDISCDGIHMIMSQGKKVVTQRLNSVDEMPTIPPVPLDSSFKAKGEDLLDFIKPFKAFELIKFNASANQLSCLVESKARTVENALDIELEGPECVSWYRGTQLMAVLDVFKGDTLVKLKENFPVLMEMNSETMDLRVLVAPGQEE